MDFEKVFWDIWFLFVRPSRVYRNVKYHKQTKNQWARDDPAFVVVLIFFMGVASLAYAVAFEVPGVLNIIRIMLGSIVVDFLGLGVIMATGGWWLSNKYLKDSPNMTVDQDVEWLYAFDIHCNAYMPPFFIIYVLQYFLLPLFMRDTFFATFLANSTYVSTAGGDHILPLHFFPGIQRAAVSSEPGRSL